MSLLMQALRKAERARSHSGDEHEQEHHFGQDAVPSPPPIEGGPAFAVMPDAWRLEPLDAEPPVIAAEEAAHDPVPPQARHEPSSPSPPRFAPSPAISPAATASDGTTGEGRLNGRDASSAGRSPGVRNPGALPSMPPRAIASSQRRLIILAGTLAALLLVFTLIYWRAVSGPGPGARLPMVPMPAAGAPPTMQAGTPAASAIPVAQPVAAADGALAAPPAEAATAVPPVAAVMPAATANAAPASKPRPGVTIPTPDQLAAIPDPAIRAEAMRDAAERAARQATMEGAPPTGTATGAAATLAAPSEPAVVRHRPQQQRSTGQALAAATGGRAEKPRATPPTAVGENGDVRFVRSADATQVAPAVQHGYTALQSGDLATARQQYDHALLQDPNNRDALLGSAAVAMREHDTRQASANFLRMLELDPNDPEALAGLAELRPGDLQESEIRLRGLARQHPESGPVQFALGNLYARQGRWPEAQQSYFRAFTAIPDNADYAFNLGVGLDRMNQPRLAKTYYRRALELAQSSPPGFNIDAVRKRLQALETPAQ
jgi:Tfp pilus assembly protein PilF